MQAVLARLTAADLLMSSSTTTVYEVSAVIRDLITVCEPELTFRAIAQHVNDVFQGDSPYTVAYYNGSYNSDIIKMLPAGQVLSQGQEVALCMFIRANLPLDVMTQVITYGQLVTYLHKVIAATATSGSDSALTVALAYTRRNQYDLSTIVGSNGVPSVAITPQISTVTDLLHVVSLDTYATTNQRLWLLAKAAHPTHDIHKISNLTLSSYSVIAGVDDNVVSGSYDSAYYKGFKFTVSTATVSLFSYSEVITYILNYTANSSITINSKTIYLNGSTATVAGTINGDGLISSSTISTLTPSTLIANGATIANLFNLGVPLNDIIALNTQNSTAITLAQASATGLWTTAQIAASNFTFAQKTSDGTDFKYYKLLGVAAPDREFLRQLIELYTTTSQFAPSNVFVVAVKARYTALTGISQSPVGDRAVAIAVIGWLFANTELYTLNRTPAKVMLDNGVITSIPFFQSFFGTPSISNLSITLYDVFDGASIATVDSTGLLLQSGFSAYELKTNFGITAGVARDNGWSPALISATYTPSEIFSNAHKRQSSAYKAASPYALSVIEALLGYNVTTSSLFFTVGSAASQSVAMIGNNSNSNATPLDTRYNYDAIPYATLATLLPPSTIFEDIKTALTATSNQSPNTTSTTFAQANMKYFPKLTLTANNMSAFIDALNLPFTVASALVGAQYGSSSSTKIQEVDLANTTIYSKVERRSLFTDLSDAASKYAKSGYPLKSFIALGFPASAWAAYAAPVNFNNRSVTISLRDLLSATETVEDYDDDFYISPTSTKRALYHTVADRKALILAFIPLMTDAEATILARGPVSDVPLAVV